MSRANTGTDSLDLLLGPMCNTFGVIVLVACITALLARAPVDGLQKKVNPADELLQRHLKEAQTEKDKLNALLSAAPSAAPSSHAGKIADLEKLRKDLANLEDESEKLDKVIVKNAADLSKDPGAQIRSLKAEQRSAQRDLDALKTRAESLNEQIAQARLQEQNFDRKRNDVTKERTVKWRLPLEHTSSLRTFTVIARYGKIYPLWVPGNKSSENPDVTRTEPGTGKTRYDPSPDAGWPVTDNRTSRLLAALKDEEVYIVVYTYPDSFDACRNFRQAIINEGLQFGLRVMPADQPLIFAEGGVPPPPPL